MDSVVSSILRSSEISMKDREELKASLVKMSQGIKKDYPEIYFKVFLHCWKKLGVGFFDDFNVDMIVIPAATDDVDGFGFKIMARCTSLSGGIGLSHWEEDIDGIETPLSTGFRFTPEQIMGLYEIAALYPRNYSEDSVR